MKQDEESIKKIMIKGFFLSNYQFNLNRKELYNLQSTHTDSINHLRLFLIYTCFNFISDDLSLSIIQVCLVLCISIYLHLFYKSYFKKILFDSSLQSVDFLFFRTPNHLFSKTNLKKYDER